MTKSIGDLYSGPGSNPIAVLLPGTIFPVWDPTLGTKTGAALMSTAQIAMLTATEANKQTLHALLGLVDTVGPKPTGVAATDTANLTSFFSTDVSAGTSVLFKTGTYSINSIISVPDGIEMWGAGNHQTDGTIFKMANGANLDATIASQGWLSGSATPPVGVMTHYHNFCVDGNRTNQSSGLGHGLVTFNQGSRIIHVNAVNNGGDGICPSSGTQAGFATSSVSCNEINIFRCIARNNGGAGIHIDEFNSTAILTDGFITECITDGNSNGDYGIQSDNGAGWIIQGNHVYAVKKSGIRVDRAFGVRIVNDYIEGFGFHATPGSYYGIDMDTVGVLNGSATFITGCEIKTPITNPATGTALFGIGIQSVTGATVANANISGNILNGRTWTTATTPILIHNQSASNVFNVVESNNVITGWDVPVKIGSAVTINLASTGNTGDARLVATTFGATPTILPAAVEAAGGTWMMTLTGNCAPTITAGRDGQIATFIVIEDGTGGRTFTAPASFSGWTAITTAAGTTNVQSMKWISALSKWVAMGAGVHF